MLPENRMKKKKQRTKQKIIRHAIELIEQQGFQATTMDQIAIKADIARKTLYNHFPVKEAIVEAYVRDQSLELAETTWKKLDNYPDTPSRLLTALDTAYAWVETNPELTAICLGYRMKNMWLNDGNDNEETGTQQLMAEILRRGQQNGEIRADISLKLLVTQLDILRGATVMGWLHDKQTSKLREEIARIVDLFLHGAADKKIPQQ